MCIRIMYIIQIMLRRLYVFVVVHKSDYFIAGSKSQKMLNSKTAIRQKTSVYIFHDQSRRKTANNVTCIQQIRMYVHAGIHTFLFTPCKKKILRKCIFLFSRIFGHVKINKFLGLEMREESSSTTQPILH